MARFSRFAPVLRISERKPETKAPISVDMSTPRLPMANPSFTSLDEIQVIEDEWRQRIQPEGLVEETLCAQLAHATWHLRCLHRAEREAIAAAVRNRSFNGESAVSLMTWRRSAETAIHHALEQLQSYRQISTGPTPALPAPAEVNDLLALAHSVAHARSHAASAYGD